MCVRKRERGRDEGEGGRKRGREGGGAQAVCLAAPSSRVSTAVFSLWLAW